MWAAEAEATRLTPPSSNRTCRFPASGSRSNSRLGHRRKLTIARYRYTKPIRLNCSW